MHKTGKITLNQLEG